MDKIFEPYLKELITGRTEELAWAAEKLPDFKMEMEQLKDLRNELAALVGEEKAGELVRIFINGASTYAIILFAQKACKSFSLASPDIIYRKTSRHSRYLRFIIAKLFKYISAYFMREFPFFFFRRPLRSF